MEEWCGLRSKKDLQWFSISPPDFQRTIFDSRSFFCRTVMAQSLLQLKTTTAQPLEGSIQVQKVNEEGLSTSRTTDIQNIFTRGGFHRAIHQQFSNYIIHKLEVFIECFMSWRINQTKGRVLFCKQSLRFFVRQKMPLRSGRFKAKKHVNTL